MKVEVVAAHATRPVMKHSILVVDDDAAVACYIASVASLCGARADVAASGTEALQLLRRSRYDAICLDLLLPEINGYEVLRYIRATHPEYAGRVAIVTAASRAMTEGLGGAADCVLLRKPVNHRELTAFVENCLLSGSDA